MSCSQKQSTAMLTTLALSQSAKRRTHHQDQTPVGRACAFNVDLLCCKVPTPALSVVTTGRPGLAHASKEQPTESSPASIQSGLCRWHLSSRGSLAESGATTRVSMHALYSSHRVAMCDEANRCLVQISSTW